MCNDPTNLIKDQLDFAWKWFVYHADQRMKMFNFMLVVFGVLSTAIVTAISNKISPFVEIVLCFMSSVLAVAFYLLDRRNYKLVELGRDALVILERNYLFKVDATVRSQNCPAIVSNQVKKDEEAKTILQMLRKGMHRVWIPAIAGSFGVIFIIGAIVISYQNWPWANFFKQKSAESAQLYGCSPSASCYWDDADEVP
jgi:hypothetical protein